MLIMGNLRNGLELILINLTVNFEGGIPMKKRKWMAALVAATMTITTGLTCISAAAEETKPDPINGTVNAEELLTEAFQNTTSPLSASYRYLLDGTYTFSEVFNYYDFHTMELEEDLYYFFACKEGAAPLQVVVYSDFDSDKLDRVSAGKVNDYLLQVWESGETFWYGQTIDVLPYILIYTESDGFYCENFNKPMDYVWGEVPASPLSNGEVGEEMEPDEPVIPITTTTAAPNVSVTDGVYCGDMNLDGVVDLVDAVLLSKVVSGSVQLNDLQFLAADCDSNGSLDANDSVVLVQFLVHKVDYLPYTGA